MLAGNWFGKKRFSSLDRTGHKPLAKGRRRKEAAGNRALRVEELEDRRMLATYIVNNLGDLDDMGNVMVGSLRNALQLANASPDEADTIVFADYLFTHPTTRATVPGTIILDGRPNGRQLSITDDVQILGPGSATLTIQAGGTFRLFETNIDSEEQIRPVTIGGMTLSGGALTGTDDSDDNRGGAILNREGLTLIETVVEGNFANWGGGAVYSPIGSVDVVRSLFIGNQSGGGGGAILIGAGDDELRPNLTVDNSTFTQNSTFSQFEKPGYGGAIYNRSGDVIVVSSTLTNNNASAGGGGIATYGVTEVEDTEVRPISTALSHNIVFGNTGIATLDDPTDNSDDVYPVRRDLEGALLAPTLDLDLAGGYNFIGHIGGAALRGNPNDDAEPTNPLDTRRFNFYEVVGAPADEEGITWTAANLFTNFNAPSNLIHLASISGNAPDANQMYDPMLEFEAENEFVFGLIDDPQYWIEFTPSAPQEGPPPPQNIGPWTGGLSVDDVWEWVTTDLMAMPNPIDPFDYDAWANGQPDGGTLISEPDDEPPVEDRIAYFSDASPSRAATWGDLPAEPEGEQAPRAFIVEYDQGNNYFGLDPLLLPLDDYGGPTPVFYPNSSIPSPLIDAGSPTFGSGIPQRGTHFARVAGDAIDIGAVEVQQGTFVVDELLDETDGQYAEIVTFENGLVTFADPTYSFPGDFSLREAVEFSEKNPEFDTILFSNTLLNQPDSTPSPAPTILLKLTSPFDTTTGITITRPVDIFGPSGFELEIDASGNDPTPSINNSDGTRVFAVNDFTNSFVSQVYISNLTLLGGDVVGDGGAVHNQEDLVLDSVNIKNNFASGGGGGVSTVDNDLAIFSSALFNNEAGFQGGALLVDEGNGGNISTASVNNSTISGNSAARGAGILNDNSELRVEFSTITQNSGPAGAGVANTNRPNSFTQFGSSILSGNFGDDVRVLQGAVPNIQSLGFNLVGVSNVLAAFNQPGDQINVFDPMLAPLKVEGGFTPVHRLLAGSPAIDAGDSTAVAGVGDVPMYDQRGLPFTRVFDGLQDTKDRIDIGAYEFQGTTFVVDTAIDENDGDISPGNLSLREAIQLSNNNPLPDTIMFAPGLAGQTIFQNPKNGGFLQPGTPTDMRITDSVNIIGLGENLLTLDGSNALTDLNVIPPVGEPDGRSRFFTIDDGNGGNDINVFISGLTFANSINVTVDGASIHSVEDLQLKDVTFINNSTFGDGNDGGAVYQQNGSISLEDVNMLSNTTDGVDSDGGALYARDTHLTILRSTISGNATTQTLGSGGGFYIRGGTLDMMYSYVSANLAPGGEADGGGIFGRDSILNISNSYITSNQMTGSNSEGAGIHARDSILTLTNSLVSLNKTTGTQSEGAGVYLKGGTATIQQSTISINETTGLTSTGGGIAVVDGQLTLQGSTVDRNKTTGQSAPGGGIHNLGGVVTLIDSTVSGNSATGNGSRGGGVFSNVTPNTSDKTLLINATVSGNSAAQAGGGIYNAGGVTELRHSTVTNNRSPFLGTGAGVASLGTAGSTLTRVYSTIIAGNFATSDPSNPNNDVDSPSGSGQNSFQSLGYNVIGKGLPLAMNAFHQAGDQTNITDPLLLPLQFNGGPTRTHAAIDGSAAVNAGDPNAIPGVGNVPQFDQRGAGFPRTQPGTRMDVGATESPFVSTLEADFDGDGDVDGADFLSWQRGFGKLAPSKSDGDANNDGSVNNIDVGIWQTQFGTGVASLAAVAAAESSEPLLVAAVYSTSTTDDAVDANQLSGLTLDDETSFATTEVVVLVADNTSSENSDAKDALFADLAPSTTDDGYESLTSASDSDDAELSLTVEDELFALLGDEGV